MIDFVEVKEILKNYKDIKVKIRLGCADEKAIQVIDFIDKYIQFLDVESRDIIKALYLERKNICHMAKQGYFSRRNFYYKAEKIVEKMAEMLATVLKP